MFCYLFLCQTCCFVSYLRSFCWSRWFCFGQLPTNHGPGKNKRFFIILIFQVWEILCLSLIWRKKWHLTRQQAYLLLFLVHTSNSFFKLDLQVAYLCIQRWPDSLTLFLLYSLGLILYSYVRLLLGGENE